MVCPPDSEVVSLYSLRVMAAGLLATIMFIFIPVGVSAAATAGGSVGVVGAPVAVSTTTSPTAVSSPPTVSSPPASTGTTAPGMATFNGKKINLAKGWGAAKACLVWRSHGIAECFSSEAQLDSRESSLRSTFAGTGAEVAAPTAASPATAGSFECSSALNLYSGAGYTGWHLALWDEGYWQNLSWYGFGDVTASFIGGACGFHLAQGAWGAGWWYPGYTGAWAVAYDMGAWDRTISSVYIN